MKLILGRQNRRLVAFLMTLFVNAAILQNSFVSVKVDNLNQAGLGFFVAIFIALIQFLQVKSLYKKTKMFAQVTCLVFIVAICYAVFVTKFL